MNFISVFMIVAVLIISLTLIGGVTVIKKLLRLLVGLIVAPFRIIKNLISK